MRIGISQRPVQTPRSQPSKPEPTPAPVVTDTRPCAKVGCCHAPSDKLCDYTIHQVLHEYDADGDDELPLVPGQIVRIVEQEEEVQLRFSQHHDGCS